ncbi:MAG: SPOR domain-containing protein [Allosphingosinicella sp.]|uniref:SPOR domain-containing protein n=1 Tax=Allosphingosinicella sp. TaxID=2823234 RepID=UPI00393273DE
MNQLAIKFAVSTMVLGSTMVGCSLDWQMYGIASASAKAVRAEQDAGQLFQQAHAALQRGDAAAALGLAERAVELSPRDSAYRMLLADLYVKSGRFASAEATYRDVLELQPDHIRAGLTLALSQIAQGRNGAALGQLDLLAGKASAGDLGLAFALAGQPERAIELLEPAARAADANGRVRQNLALAYALAGDWQRARVVAAQDVSPDELSARLQQWAALARSDAPSAQVAALLNVTPAEDPGRPARLALAPLAPEPQPVALAAVEPPVVPAEPVQYASLAPVAPDFYAPAAAETQAVETPTVEADEFAPLVLRPAETRAEPLLAPRAEPRVEPLRPAAAPAAQRPVRAAASGVHSARPGRFVVQLGAFSNVQNAERAWADAERRYGFAQAQGVTTTFDHGGRTLHRVAVGGFDDQAAAMRACQSVKAKGGACFVRGVAGDTPVQLAWANVRRTRA